MTVANVNTKELYNGTGVLTTFAIPFAFIPGEASIVTKVYLEDNAGVQVLLTEGIEYTLDPAGDNPVNVIMALAPDADQKLLVKRISPKTQNLDLDDNTPIPAEELEKQLDREVFLNQEALTEIEEIEAGGATSTIVSGTIVPDWVAATDYLTNQLIIDSTSTKLYRALTDHTSTGSFNADLVNGDWEILPTTGLEGAAGPVGGNGPTGPQGIQGPAGANGVNGLDGVFVSIASKAEAEAGIENTKGMTALRTKEAIDFQLPLHATILAMLVRIGALEAVNADQETRLISLETNAISGNGRFSGSQIIYNNSGPTSILGGTNPAPGDGRGTALNRNSAGTNFAKVQFSIKRQSTTDFRIATLDLIMQFNAATNTWFIGRDNTDQLDGSLDLDGIILTVTTTPDGFGGFIGQVFYTADNMAGANHDTQSELKWIGQEIPKNV